MAHRVPRELGPRPVLCGTWPLGEGACAQCAWLEAPFSWNGLPGLATAPYDARLSVAVSVPLLEWSEVLYSSLERC